MENENDKHGKASQPLSINLNGGPFAPQSELYMSSQEIAEVAVSRHDKIKRSIERLVSRGDLVQPSTAYDQEFDAMGRSRVTSIYLLNKRDSYVVVAQFSPKVIVRLVCKWNELEGQSAAEVPDLGDPVAGARAGTHAAINRRVEAECRIAEMVSKVEALNRLEALKGSLNIRLVAKTLNVPERNFIKWLLLNGWAFRQNGVGALRARTAKRNLGLLEHKPNGSQLIITAKGLVRLAQLVPTMAP